MTFQISLDSLVGEGRKRLLFADDSSSTKMVSMNVVRSTPIRLDYNVRLSVSRNVN